MKLGERRGWGLAQAVALLVGLAGAAPAWADGAYLRTYLLLGEDGARIARAVTGEPTCPPLLVDGLARPCRCARPPGLSPSGRPSPIRLTASPRTSP